MGEVFARADDGSLYLREIRVGFGIGRDDLRPTRATVTVRAGEWDPARAGWGGGAVHATLEVDVRGDLRERVARALEGAEWRYDERGEEDAAAVLAALAAWRECLAGEIADAIASTNP